ncbi:MAG: hypothetical protein JRH17_05730 [Deltaproteobacteria bacterium]|nr:hypothetical protein [Deltaproteobacteria bacterium]MBW2695762.1 hypothetical protein [Deltaproteobacteria bacterium]
MRAPLPVILGLLVVLSPIRADSDALVVSRAMFADTIAEYFVEEDGVRVDLEIGSENLESFRNLLPDDLYERLGHDPLPMSERMLQFFQRELALVADGGDPLPGRLLALEPGRRVERDALTGEPLADAGDDRLVVRARLFYPFTTRPSKLQLLGGTSPASIGFVAYHEGIAVNDFRYLGRSQSLLLDWEDPFYTRFERRALRRQYFAPMTGFIYVEPYEVRKEIVLRPRDLQDWVDLGLEGRETIPVEMQPELERRVANFLRDRHVVRIDGREPEPQLARVNFLERTLRTSRVVDPRRELDLNGAILGVIFVYPTTGLPQKVTMDWDLWNEKIQRVPVSSVDQAGPLPVILEPEWRVLEWQNFLKHPELPTLQVVAAPPGRLAALVWILRWPALVLGAMGIAWSALRRRTPAPMRVPLALAGVALLIAGGGFGFTARTHLSHSRTQDVVSALLHNVYRAFDFRDEEQIYDVLAQSVEGDLLEQIYLETRRGLELASQGGARAKVKQVELDELEIERVGADGFVARAVWKVRGSVGHWGHIHQRSNRYRAELTVAPVEERWKLTALEILEEERL